MALFRLKVTSPQNLAAGFESFAQNMTKYAIQEPIDNAFRQAAQRARADAPVKTGRLRSSIRVEKRPNSTSLVASAPYAKTVDDRTGFFTNAVENVQRNLPGQIQRKVNEQAGIMTRKFFSG